MPATATTAIALTIAGSDPSGGAGIQADLKTFHQFGVYGEAVITLLTVQNTVRVSRVEVMPPAAGAGATGAVLEDMPPAAAKTGALGSAEMVSALAKAAAQFQFPLVVDPVMVSKHGTPLLPESARSPPRLARPGRALDDEVAVAEVERGAHHVLKGRVADLLEGAPGAQPRERAAQHAAGGGAERHRRRRPRGRAPPGSRAGAFASTAPPPISARTCGGPSLVWRRMTTWSSLDALDVDAPAGDRVDAAVRSRA